MKPIYVAGNDSLIQTYPGTYTNMLWANQSKLRAGQAGLDLQVNDVVQLAQATRAGAAAYPVWGGTVTIPPFTATCLDLDWYAEQGWDGNKLAEYYAAYRSVNSGILTCYNVGAEPLANYLDVRRELSANIINALRAPKSLAAIIPFLSFVPIRCPLFPGWDQLIHDGMARLVKVQREVTPGVPVYMWLRDDTGATFITPSLEAYAKLALEVADGVVIWGHSTQMGALVAACVKANGTARPPIRPPVRNPFQI